MGIKSILVKISELKKFLKDGGVTYLNVSYVNPNQRFKDKKVLVTGGSSGLGLEMAKQYLAEGAEVLITGRKESALQEIVKSINNSKLHYIVWDLSDVINLKQKFNEALNMLGEVDIFVNNAGVGIKYTGWRTYTPEVFDYVHEINERGVFFMSQIEATYLLDHKISGSILNISSMASLVPLMDPYAISKWGINCITKGLAKELAGSDITVNAIAPGTVMTNIEEWYKGRTMEDNAFYSGQPSNRFTAKEEIAQLALFLTSGSARCITGQIVAADCGRYLFQK